MVNKEAGDKIMDELSKLKGEKAREFARCVNIDKLKKKNGIDNNSPLSNQPKRRSSYRYKAFSAKSLDHFYCENSLFFFSKTSKIRIFSFRIISHINFERFMNFIIFASCLALIMETYLDFESDDPFEISLIDFCNITDIFLAVIYSIEILIKGITYGMFLDRKSYLRNAWNLLDFLLSICYVIDTFTPENSNSLIIKVKI